MLCAAARARIRAWFQAYDNLQHVAVVLLYVQVGCSLIGSLGVSYTGAPLANLAIALFALVAIECRSQALGRTYVVLLVCTLLIDITWFVLFSVEIRQLSIDAIAGKFTAFSLQLVLWMQIAGFLMRFLSAFLWLQMYRLGSDQGGIYQPFDLEARSGTSGFSSSASSPRMMRQSSLSDDILGGSIYDPAHYSSLFSSPDEGHSFKKVNEGVYKGSNFHRNHLPHQIAKPCVYNNQST